MLEALHCLKRQLRDHGSGLHYMLGNPDDALPALFQMLAALGSAVDVYHYSGTGSQAVNEEQSVERRCQAAADRLGMKCDFHSFWGHTLYPPEAVLEAVSKESRSRSGARTSTSGMQAEGSHFAAIPPIMTDFRKVCSL